MVDKSQQFVTLVRVGYFARAILYITLGLVALTGAAAIAKGTDGVFQAIEQFPGGIVLLWIMVVGLVAYAVFRLCSPLFDIENHGSDAKGWATRIGHGGSAVAHLALAYAAYKFATSDVSAGGSDGAQQAASGMLSYTFGGVVLGLLGIAMLVAAAHQAKKGLSGEFMHRIAGGAPSATRWLGAAGYLARAVVYVVIGWSLVKAGFLSQGSNQIRTLGDAVVALAGQGFLFTLTAIGLLLFGLFSLVLARYRIIPDLDSSAGVPTFRE